MRVTFIISPLHYSFYPLIKALCFSPPTTAGCTGKSIVFVGDSAGGNLAISTAMRAQSYGLRSPDGVLAAYPVTYVKYAG